MLEFLHLNSEQFARFEGLKSSAELQSHGPLVRGEEVPLHTHREPALYVVCGLADCIASCGARRTLGNDAEVNAVRVPPEDAHGWVSLRDDTRIEHCFGKEVIDRVLAH